MTKIEWQQYHEVEDEKMTIIEKILSVFGMPGKPAKVIKIFDVRQFGRWGDGKNVLKGEMTK